jgi:hypothetical protein
MRPMRARSVHFTPKCDVLFRTKLFFVSANSVIRTTLYGDTNSNSAVRIPPSVMFYFALSYFLLARTPSSALCYIAILFKLSLYLRNLCRNYRLTAIHTGKHSCPSDHEREPCAGSRSTMVGDHMGMVSAVSLFLYR